MGSNHSLKSPKDNSEFRLLPWTMLSSEGCSVGGPQNPLPQPDRHKTKKHTCKRHRGVHRAMVGELGPTVSIEEEEERTREETHPWGEESMIKGVSEGHSSCHTLSISLCHSP